jgi:hypothetical protein
MSATPSRLDVDRIEEINDELHAVARALRQDGKDEAAAEVSAAARHVRRFYGIDQFRRRERMDARAAGRPGVRRLDRRTGTDG